MDQQFAEDKHMGEIRGQFHGEGKNGLKDLLASV